MDAKLGILMKRRKVILLLLLLLVVVVVDRWCLLRCSLADISIISMTRGDEWGRRK